MKLLIAQPYLSLRGGVDRVILKIAERYNAPIYTLEYNKKEAFPEFAKLDVRIVGKDVPLSKMLPYRASQGLRYGYNFYNLEVKEDYDVINAHISPSEWIRHKNERVLWYCHTPPREVYDLYKARMGNRTYREKIIYMSMTRAYKTIAGRIIRKIEKIVTNSDNTRKRISKYFGVNSTVISPGIDYERFGNESDGRFFFYPSRIVPNKRQDYVISAFKRFRASYDKGGRYRLILAGALSEDPEHMRYYQRLLKLAKGSNVTIRTNVNDSALRKLYSNSTAVLTAAVNEDFGIVPLEAMASWKPVVSVNEGGHRESIIEGKTGFLVNSPIEMASSMRFLVEHKDSAERMGRAGRKRVVQEYSWNSFFHKFDRAAREVMKNKEY